MLFTLMNSFARLRCMVSGESLRAGARQLESLCHIQELLTQKPGSNPLVHSCCRRLQLRLGTGEIQYMVKGF